MGSQSCRQQQYTPDLADKSRRRSAPRAHDLMETSPLINWTSIQVGPTPNHNRVRGHEAMLSKLQCQDSKAMRVTGAHGRQCRRVSRHNMPAMVHVLVTQAKLRVAQAFGNPELEGGCKRTTDAIRSKIVWGDTSMRSCARGALRRRFLSAKSRAYCCCPLGLDYCPLDQHMHYGALDLFKNL